MRKSSDKLNFHLKVVTQSFAKLCVTAFTFIFLLSLFTIWMVKLSYQQIENSPKFFQTKTIANKTMFEDIKNRFLSLLKPWCVSKIDIQWKKWKSSFLVLNIYFEFWSRFFAKFCIVYKWCWDFFKSKNGESKSF